MAVRRLYPFAVFLFSLYLNLSIRSQAVRSTTMVSAAATQSKDLIPVPENAQYTLLGCYVEPPLVTDHRALGPPGTYITPTSLNVSSMTVPLCLEACSTLLGGNDPSYTYVGLENARYITSSPFTDLLHMLTKDSECYCSSVFLLNATHVVSSSFCSSACTGNTTTACGGYGFVDIYQLTSTLSTINNTATASLPSVPSTTSSLGLSSVSTLSSYVSPPISYPTTTAIMATSSKPSLPSGAIAAIVIGTITGILIAISLLFCLRRRKKRRSEERAAPVTTQSSAPTQLFHHSSDHNISPNFVLPNPRRNGVVYASTSSVASPPPWEVHDPSQNSTLGIFRDGSRRRLALEAWKSGGLSELDAGETIGPSTMSTCNDANLLEGFQNDGDRRRVEEWRDGGSWRAGDDAFLKRQAMTGGTIGPEPFIGQDRAELAEERKEFGDVTVTRATRAELEDPRIPTQITELHSELTGSHDRERKGEVKAVATTKTANQGHGVVLESPVLGRGHVASLAGVGSKAVLNKDIGTGVNDMGSAYVADESTMDSINSEVSAMTATSGWSPKETAKRLKKENLETKSNNFIV